MSVESILVLYPAVNIVERQLLLIAREDSLGNHGSVAEGRLEIFGSISTVVNLVGTFHEHSPIVWRLHWLAVKDAQFPILLGSGRRHGSFEIRWCRRKRLSAVAARIRAPRDMA